MTPKIKPKRKSMRLKYHNYSQNGHYFVTICTRNFLPLFGKIKDEKMILNQAGKIIEKWWQKLPKRFKEVTLKEFVVMPNHFHAIIAINNTNTETARVIHESPLQPPTPVGITRKQPLTPVGMIHESSPQAQKQPTIPTGATHQSSHQRRKMLLPKIIGYFKMNTSKQINQIKNTKSKKIWQYSYYDHIIRNEQDLKRIQEYIINNPLKWHLDKFYIKS